MSTKRGVGVNAIYIYTRSNLVKDHKAPGSVELYMLKSTALPAGSGADAAPAHSNPLQKVIQTILTNVIKAKVTLSVYLSRFRAKTTEPI